MQKFQILSLFFVLISMQIPTPCHADEGKVLWDYWYTVSVKAIPYEYYNEKVVLRDGKIQFFNHVWKKEEGFINEEQLGDFSNGDVNLTPLFFNYRATYRQNEMKIDGNIHDGKTLVVKIKKGEETLPTVTRSIERKSFLSLFFPLWLGRQLKTAKIGTTAPFTTIFEDNVDQGFAPIVGRFRVEKSDDFAKQSNTQKVSVEYGDNDKAIWWVEPLGAAVRIEMPDKSTIVDRVSKEKAEAYLK
jgi:hypothetical protein